MTQYQASQYHCQQSHVVVQAHGHLDADYCHYIVDHHQTCHNAVHPHFIILKSTVKQQDQNIYR